MRFINKTWKLIEEYSGYMNLPVDIINNAKLIAEQAIVIRIAQGYKPEELATVSIYIACRRSRIPLLFKEAVRIAKASKARVKSLYRRIIQHLNLKPPVPDPSDYLIKRLAPMINIDNDVLTQAIEIINKAKTVGILHGKNPSAVAAAALYLVLIGKNKRVSMSKLARLAGVTSMTVKNILKSIMPLVNYT
ncbi:MAG: hypothetical protein ACPLQS_04150 [Desulfurococcaceae archaeon]